MKTGKHVIFLGAGASCGSGYPLANDLRLLISSKKKWEEALVQYEEKHKLTGRPITELGLNYWDYNVVALDLFRNGGFATIDEFCKLADGFAFQSEINMLRRLLRAALGLFNPEENFEKSEYYGFVQALFKEDLLTLRDDVTVITYNYDPYLEFLLHRALQHRFKVTKRQFDGGKNSIPKSQVDIALNAATSGFGWLDNQNWLEDSYNGFCLLKLHGSIIKVSNQSADFEMLFTSDTEAAKQRAEKLFSQKEYLPPILFPWEIMNEQGLTDEKLFPIHGYEKKMYDLFRGIWKRARRDIQAADKISFVGLSMHSFLFDGLKYLFEGKENKTEIVVVNPENILFEPGRTETHWNKLPNSPAYFVGRNFLGKIDHKMKMVGIPTGYAHRMDGDITLVKDFSEFIKTQMKPFPVDAQW